MQFETTCWLGRLPGLAELSFADGSPLADEHTRRWLAQLTRVPATSGAPESSLDHIVLQAHVAAQSGNLVDALNALQQSIAQSPAARDAFCLRIEMCGLLQQFDPCADLRPFVGTLLRQVDEFNLAQWEPSRAAQVFELAVTVFRTHDEARAERYLSQLAELDGRAAWSLTSRVA